MYCQVMLAVSPGLIKQMVDKYIGPHGHVVTNLMNLRTVVMCLLAYTGFLRFNELSQIKLGHISFTSDGMTLLIPSSKTDVYRSGRSVIISNTKTCFCPVEKLKSYISLAEISDPDLFIFRNVSTFKVGYKLRDPNTVIHQSEGIDSGCPQTVC